MKSYAIRGVGFNIPAAYRLAMPSGPPNPNLARALAAAIRRERHRRKWTQEEAAERAEINPRHYQKLEDGSVNATLRTLERLGRAFGIAAGRLLSK